MDQCFEDVIKAGGGLVWRDSPDGKRKQLAVIRRKKRYPGEGWTLPKGKLDSEKGDKTWKGAAKREVEEEIGLEVKVGSFAGSVSYIDKKKNKPKIVLYWNMTLTGGDKPRDSKEVTDIGWLTPEEALRELGYPGERALISARVRKKK